MQAEVFYELLHNQLMVDFFTGVPDSLLKPFITELELRYQASNKHIIAANEGNAVGLAAGHYLATNNVPCVYMQNSGLGNAINPITSLLNKVVYGIPCVFVIGWRGEPTVKDEPQHKFQGQITLFLLEILGINYVIVDDKTTIDDLEKNIPIIKKELESGNSYAFVIRKNALKNTKVVEYKNPYDMKREDVIKSIVKVSGNDIIICTTGKASRELYEVRKERKEKNNRDFLTVGSMGHSSSIALGIALKKQDKKVWCIDGDGAVLMHMGAMAIIGDKKPANFVHIVLNNEAHETVGGMATSAGKVRLYEIARECGYEMIFLVHNEHELNRALTSVKAKNGLAFIEVKVALGARKDLGRPTTSTFYNKEEFMKFIREE